MKKINANTRSIAIKIASQAFLDNPSMNQFLNPRIAKEKAMHALCAHCVDLSMLKDGAYISDDMCCICLLFHSDSKVDFWDLLRLNFQFVMRCCGWAKVYRILKREKFMKTMRMQGEYLYCQILANNKQAGNASVIEAKKFMFDMGDRLNLPIVAETCLSKNKVVYEHFGFKTYGNCLLPHCDVKMWFLKRAPV